MHEKHCGPTLTKSPAFWHQSSMTTTRCTILETVQRFVACTRAIDERTWTVKRQKPLPMKGEVIMNTAYCVRHFVESSLDEHLHKPPIDYSEALGVCQPLAPICFARVKYDFDVIRSQLYPKSMKGGSGGSTIQYAKASRSPPSQHLLS